MRYHERLIVIEAMQRSASRGMNPYDTHATQQRELPKVYANRSAARVRRFVKYAGRNNA